MEIGHVEAIFRYPVKSMGGERLDAATLGWHGVDGDRRLALRRLDDRGGFPWLTAGRLPNLLRFTPTRVAGAGEEEVPTHVRTPEGDLLPVFGEALAADIGRRHKAPVQMMHLRHGVFDDATVSVIATDTVDEIGRLAGLNSDVRRFRPNVLVRLRDTGPFQENAWVGRVLSFGAEAGAPSIAVTMPDIRCAMVNFNPDSAVASPAVMRAIVRANDNTAGIYGTVIRAGRLAVGQTIHLG